MISLATVKPQQYGLQEVDILLSSNILFITWERRKMRRGKPSADPAMETEDSWGTHPLTWGTKAQIESLYQWDMGTWMLVREEVMGQKRGHQRHTLLSSSRRQRLCFTLKALVTPFQLWVPGHGGCRGKVLQGRNWGDTVRGQPGRCAVHSPC